MLIIFGFSSVPGEQMSVLGEHIDLSAHQLSGIPTQTATPTETATLTATPRPTRTPTRLSRAERAENMRAAFRVAPGLDLGGSRIVLVDDVLTTGATTSACARALRQAGAGEVCVWTVARGL